jgi:hypothetical protein
MRRGFLSWSTTQPPIGEGVDLHFGNKGKDTESKGSGKGTGTEPAGSSEGKGTEPKGGMGEGNEPKGKGTEPKGSGKGKGTEPKGISKGKPGPEPNVEGFDQETRTKVLLAWAAASSVCGECADLWAGCDPEEQEEENNNNNNKKKKKNG